jgi:hypothetical protein
MIFNKPVLGVLELGGGLGGKFLSAIFAAKINFFNIIILLLKFAKEIRKKNI